MARDLPRIGPESLYLRRLATRALDLVLARFGLGAMALRFNADDPTQVLPGGEPGEVRFYEDTTIQGHQALALVWVEGSSARVMVDDLRAVVRRNHRRDFRPAELEPPVVHREGVPDVFTELDVLEALPAGEAALMRSAPQRVIQRRRRPGDAGVVPAVSALRGR